MTLTAFDAQTASYLIARWQLDRDVMADLAEEIQHELDLAFHY